MARSKKQIAGWVLTGLLALFLIGVSAVPKFTDWPGRDEMFQKLGLTTELVAKIGVIEIIVTILFVIPRTGFVGAILLTGYLGGAVLTHMRIGDPVFFPIVMGVLVWTALGLRRPEVFRLAVGATPPVDRPQ